MDTHQRTWMNVFAMHINKVGEFAFALSKQKRGIPLRRVKESVFGIEAKAKTRGVQK